MSICCAHFFFFQFCLFPLGSGGSWIFESFNIQIFWISFILLILSSSFRPKITSFFGCLDKAESKIKLYHILTLANHSPKLYFSKHMACFSSFYKGHITKCFATAHKSSSLSKPFWFPHGLPSDHQCEKNVKMKMLVALLCPTLCNPMECSPPDFSVHGILQARTWEWVAIFSSRVSSWLRNWTQVSCIAGGFFTIWTTRSDH